MRITTPIDGFDLRTGQIDDVPLLLSLIRELAGYEKLSHEAVATEDMLRNNLFGERRFAEALLGEYRGEPAAFALFFHNFSTFVGKPGLYLEDLYVRSHLRGNGFGRAMLAYLARLARERGCGRLEWSVLDWNAPALHFYRALGAKAMDEWTVHRVSGRALEELADKF